MDRFTNDIRRDVDIASSDGGTFSDGFRDGFEVFGGRSGVSRVGGRDVIVGQGRDVSSDGSAVRGEGGANDGTVGSGKAGCLLLILEVWR